MEFSFLNQQGGLREQWYSVCFEDELQKGKPIRRVALGMPLVLWRSAEPELSHGADDAIRCFVDVCPHRQAPLSAGVVEQNEIVCPYHGWRFNEAGVCTSAPADPVSRCDSARLQPVATCVHAGIVWVWMGETDPNSVPAVASQLSMLPSFSSKSSWRFWRTCRPFAFDLDDVIENFMDFAHTGIVHPGLIRGMSTASERDVTIETSETKVRATHEPVNEKVGFLSGLIIPRNTPVHHADTFIAPSNVLVEYWFGEDGPAFFAFLGLTPVNENQTQILLTIGVRFGLWNPLIKLTLPWLVKKVLAQDEQILSQQRDNLDLLTNYRRHSLQADAIDGIVRAMRLHLRDPSATPPKLGTKSIRVRA